MAEGKVIPKEGRTPHGVRELKPVEVVITPYQITSHPTRGA